jgi:ATP-dependent helicase/nuclease subunit A
MSTLTDDHKRNRIGPWKEEALPSLSDFEPNRNFVVRASAGSGKTTALVARMVALVRQGAAPGDMAAITFTRKAAGEMRQRFFRELRKARSYLSEEIESKSDHIQLSSEELALQRERVEEALGEIQQCFIGTIHSFCARILREHAIEVGLPPDFTAGLDERDERELRERAWQSYLEDMWENDMDAIEHLDELGVDVGELEGTFGKLCGNPDLEPYVDGPDSMPDLSRAAEEARSFVETYAPYLTEPKPDANAGEVSQALRSARLFLQNRSLEAPAARADFLELFEGMAKEDTRKSTDTEVRGDLKNKGDHWIDTELADRLDNEAVPAFVEDVIGPALSQWRAYGHRQIMEFLQPAVRRYRNRRREEGQLTFVDLLVETRRLLRENPLACESLQSRYPRILVDEFQDTDPIQAELLFYLTGKNTGETEDWTQRDPRPGSLFIVGDDQQSIYGFRRADMRVFNQVKALLSGPEGRNALQLESNFRSLSPICEWCDSAFSELFAEGVDEGVQAEHQSFSPTRATGGEENHIRVLEVPGVSWNPAEDIARKNARQVARFVADAVESDEPVLDGGETDGEPVPGDPEDFMILTRNKGRLAVFAEELASRDVPYALSGGEDLGSSSELRALVDLLACAGRPDDPVARVAYLRGALVGLSDEELYRLKSAGFNYGRPEFELPEAAKQKLSDELARRTERALSHLKAARSLLEKGRPAAAIGKIVDRTGLFGRALDDPVHGSLRAGRLSRLMALVRGLDQRNLHWTETLDELRRLADGDTEEDGLTLDVGTGGAVRLLNVHKAKGLEAPIVILADPYHKDYPREPSQHVDRNDQTDEHGEVVLPIYEQKRWRREFRWGPQGWKEKYKEKAMREKKAEERRLQYVAATRAEDCLVVSRYSKESEDGFWANLYPYLEDCPPVGMSSSEGGGGEDESVEGESGQGESDEDMGLVDSDLPIPDFDGLASIRGEAGSGAPTYETHAVTEGLESGWLSEGSQEGRYGREFGDAVHNLLEKVVNEPEAAIEDEDIRRALGADREAEKGDQVEVAGEMVRRFRESDIFKTVLSAETVLTELPLCGSSAERDASEAGPDAIVRGTIDLIYREGGGWHLVDYKTNAVDNNPEALADHYKPQLRNYIQLWTQQTGEKIQSARLWFADTGESVTMTL